MRSSLKDIHRNIREAAGSPRISSEAHNGKHHLCDTVAT